MINRTAITCAVLAAFLGASGLAIAQPRGEHDNRNGNKFENGHDNRYDGRSNDRALYERRDYGNRGEGAGPDHNFHRGGRVPVEYRSRQYVVNDWRGHNLRQPPRGQQWVQVGGDYLLVAIATGLIADLLINR